MGESESAGVDSPPHPSERSLYLFADLPNIQTPFMPDLDTFGTY